MKEDYTTIGNLYFLTSVYAYDVKMSVELILTFNVRVGHKLSQQRNMVKTLRDKTIMKFI